MYKEYKRVTFYLSQIYEHENLTKSKLIRNTDGNIDNYSAHIAHIYFFKPNLMCLIRLTLVNVTDDLGANQYQTDIMCVAK